MEQRIGTSSQPLEGAGFDPAFVPGLTSPVSKATEPEESESKESEDRREETAEVTEEVAEDTAEDTAEAADAAEPADEKGESADDRATDDTDTEDDDEAAADGPVFEASDRRAKIVADRRGVRLTLDDQECEFRWDEIGAVETETARFGKRFTVTVHTPDRRWYPIEIEAAARSRFSEWESQLDAVLDAYFEESD
ncbi:hypothetical protein [Streptomyces sp. NPDC000983]|uniref:hypothetical protein n=1 Tax=Streptomyces sp. NPDC000983 TaxID=3154373 RepID=UPI00331F91A8